MRHAEDFSGLSGNGNVLTRAAGFLDATIAAFDREIRFYIACRNYIQLCRDAGLKFSYPVVSGATKSVRCEEISGFT